MKATRRTFLRTAAAVATTGAAVPATLLTAAHSDAISPVADGDMPKGMTFVTIKRGDEMSLGVKTDQGILDVKKAEARFKAKAPTTIDEVLRRGGDATLRTLVQKARAANGKGGLFLSEDQVQFGPCVTSPEKIICVGLNYRKHAAETGNPVPKVPILFNKYNSALSGHRGVLQVSKEPAERFDYETELVIVIGKTARGVSEADALDHVFGYATGNDFTARDLQSLTSQWMLGKSLDGFGIVGPYLVCADLVGDPNNLKIETRVNGEVRQSNNTNDMVFNCKQLVAWCAKHFTLKPGDLIYTGTPEGVIAGYPKEKQVWLKAGDKVVSSIEKLGSLEVTLA